MLTSRLLAGPLPPPRPPLPPRPAPFAPRPACAPAPAPACTPACATAPCGAAPARFVPGACVVGAPIVNTPPLLVTIILPSGENCGCDPPPPTPSGVIDPSLSSTTCSPLLPPTNPPSPEPPR